MCRPGRAQLLIITVEQLFKSCKGHFPQLALLMRNLGFQKHVECVFVDEAHSIHFASQAHYGLNAFCPAWGCLDELKAVLPQNVCWTVLSATFPPHVLATVKKKLLRPGYEAINVTSNRPNMVYATHEVINNIKDLQNYNCFPASPFSMESQPRIHIFVDKKDLACQITAHMDSSLPTEH